MSKKKRYIEKFIENKKVPNEYFTLINGEEETISIDLNTTVQKIYDSGQGKEVKKMLKQGVFRNASIEKCLKLFEGAAQRFLLENMGKEVSEEVQDILKKVHRRGNSVFITFKEADNHQQYEVIFVNKDEKEEPYLLKNMGTKEIHSFSKKGFIENLLNRLDEIKEVI